MAETPLPRARHESQDVSFRFLATGFAGVLLTILACMLFVLWLYPRAAVDRRLGGTLPQYPAPQLQADPQADLHAFVASEMQRLNSVGWVDRAHGVVHIPIAEAMRMVASQGIQDWPSRPEARR